jgi:class 3 adenylate cyclase
LRIALHTGEAEPREGGYRGRVVEHVQRLLDAAHGGQILCSEETAALVARDTGPALRLIPLGSFRLPGSRTEERLFQIECTNASRF